MLEGPASESSHLATQGGSPHHALPNDPDPKLAQYAHPDKLVTTAWLTEHLDDPGLVVAESDDDTLYETGPIPGAMKEDWHYTVRVCL